ncbi:MAG: lipocalin family protein [Flavobacterium sp.]
MNKLKLITGFFLMLVSFTFTSCENEPVDPALDPGDFGSCAVPTAFASSGFNNNTVTLSWIPGDDETSWTVEYGIVGFEHGQGTTVGSSNATLIITGLNSNNSYSFYVKSNCTATSSSNWVGPITVDAIQQNPNCPNPGGLTATRDAGVNSNVNLLWVAGGTETQWEIQFGVSGFTLGTGTTVSSNNTTATVTGVIATSSYDFYVRSKCSASSNSGWIGPVVVASVGGNPTGSVAGNYKLTAFNTSVPTDLNLDGTASTNQMNETTCMNNMFLTLNANNTFSADSKGTEIDMDIDVATGEIVQTIQCFSEAALTGTWSLSGTTLSLTYIDPDTGTPATDNFTVIGNTLQATLHDGQAVGTVMPGGEPVYLTCDITSIYTKQ